MDLIPDVPVGLEKALVSSLALFVLAVVFLLGAARQVPKPWILTMWTPQTVRHIRRAFAASLSLAALVVPHWSYSADQVFDSLYYARHEAGYLGWGLNLGFFGSVATLAIAVFMQGYIRRTEVQHPGQRRVRIF